MKLLLVFVGLAVAHAEHHEPDHIIRNGYAAYEGKAPYIVSLFLGNEGSNSGAVGDGTIIAHNWVLTAAHCLTTDFAVIHYGSNWARNGQYNHKVWKSNFIRHELWPNSAGHDIGLIRTPHVDFTDRVNKVALPKFGDWNNRYENWWAVACGWGGMANGQLADWLQCMDVQITSNQECARAYGNAVTDTVLCTRNTDGKSVCGGDSGGPLVTHDNPILVGVIVFAHPQCGNGPSGYTRVGSHLDWIRAKSGVAYY